VWVTWAATSGSGGPFESHFLVNGSPVAIGTAGIQNDNTHATQQLNSTPIYCGVGDVVTVQVTQRTGVALNVTAATFSLVRR